jgi:hypothetical protein
MDKNVLEFEKLKTILENILGSEESVRVAWNEYQQENIETETQPPIYHNNHYNVEYLLNYMSTDGIAQSMLNGEFDSAAKYVYEFNDTLKTTNSVYGIINLYKLYQYVINKKLAKLSDLFIKAKKLKNLYNNASRDELFTLYTFADESADFLDSFIKILKTN